MFNVSNEKKRILFVAADIKFANYSNDLFRILRNEGYIIDVVVREGMETIFQHIELDCDNCYFLPLRRKPISIYNIIAYFRLKKLIKEKEYSIIHCHTPVASAITRLAARDAHKEGTKIIYTAHGFHFWKGAPIFNWLFYYPIEKLCSKYTDMIITINNEDYYFAKKFFKTKVMHVKGVGIKLDNIAHKTDKHHSIRDLLGISKSDFVITCVGELIKRKNHSLLIKVFKELPSNMHLLIVGQGKRENKIRKLIKRNNLTNNIHVIGYRNDIVDIYLESNICILPSFQEGLPVSIMEGMACGLPCIVSKIRGCIDLIDSNGGIVCDINKIENWKKAIMYIYDNPLVARKMGIYNMEKIKDYSFDNILNVMLSIYRGNDGE